MCMIMDLNTAIEVFGESRTPAASQVYDWLNGPRCRLVIGGRLRTELSGHGEVVQWLRGAVLAGRVRQENDATVDAREAQIRQAGGYISDDPHITALAEVSGSRLLYSNDTALGRDFRDRKLLSPQGKLLPQKGSKNAQKTRQRMLSEPDLCPTVRGGR